MPRLLVNVTPNNDVYLFLICSSVVVNCFILRLYLLVWPAVDVPSLDFDKLAKGELIGVNN